MEMKTAFKAIDSNGDGTINVKELEYVLKNVSQQPLSSKEFRELVDTFDKDKNGKIEYSEFANLMQSFLNDYMDPSKKVLPQDPIFN